MSEDETVITKKAEEAPQRRRERNNITGGRTKLSVQGEEPGYHYAWINDENVGDAIDNDYEFVTHPVKIGNAHVDISKMQGSRISRNVGGGTIAHLMRIREEWYKQNQYEDVDLPTNASEEKIMVDINSNGLTGSVTKGKDAWKDENATQLWDVGSVRKKQR